MTDLQSVGLDVAEEEVYRALIERPPSTLDELSAALGHDVTVAITSLESRGLISRGPDELFAPIAPDVSLDALILARERELSRARSAYAELIARFWKARSNGDTRSLVEVITGRENVGRRVEQMQGQTQSQIRVFDKPPYVDDRTDNPGENEMLGRGVICRAVYEQSCLRLPGRLAHLEDMAALGEQCRVAPELPMKMMLCDDHLGLMPLQGGDIEGAVLVRESSLLEALSGLFETVWSQALELKFGEPSGTAPNPGEAPTPDERRLLGMLATGASDDDIAQHLGISPRTVHRRIHDLMDRLGVGSRFQVGVETCRRGWL